MTDITELTSVQKNANIHRLSRLIAYASNDELHQLAVEVEQYTDQLIEALEKAQQVDEELCKLLPPGAEYMAPPDGGDVTPLEGVRRMVVDYRQRIAELESRTVKLPDLRQIVSGDRYVWSDGVFNYSQDVKAELTAKGIKWEAE
ncbi:MAG: hypothetical protein E6157_04465 [Staphylococcus epidermidis]|nr:hypothetical protein [Staphylococcus epidermidis]OBT34824.1 hypothetical protein A9L51_18830 [Klebsiella pneumoniae]GKQ08846.1 hypothetical protein NUKP79_25670 [Klebsiella quasipneumoniae]SSN95586.1 phage EaA protein [Klebsiella pneumoniae]